MSNGEAAANDGVPMSIRNKNFAKGLGVHAPSEVRFSLNGACTALTTSMGVDDEAGNRGSVVFQIWADSVKLYDSGTIAGRNQAKSASVDLTGRSQLSLIVTDAGDGNGSDHADWANAILTCGDTTDTSAPSVTAVSPADGSTAAASLVSISATFSELISSSTVNSSTVQLRKQGTTTALPATVSFDNATLKVIVAPAAALESGVQYQVVVKGGSAGLKDLAGNALAADKIWSFNTAATASALYLSGANWTSMANGWGPAEKDMSNGEAGAGDGRPLAIRGQQFAKGIGAHSYSEIAYPVAGCSWFRSVAGVDDESNGNGSVIFQVWADGAKLYDSGVLTGTSAAHPIDVNISGRSQLSLVVTDGGNGNGYDHADWANARVECSSAPTTCTYSLQSSSASVPAAGGTGTFNVSSASGCAWTASSSATWLTVSTGSGSGAGAVQFSAAANAQNASRSGTITVSGQVFTVTQAGTTANDSGANTGSNLSSLPPPGADFYQPSGATPPGDAYQPSGLTGSAAATAPTISGWNQTAMPDESLTLTGSRFTMRTGSDQGSDTTVWIYAQNGSTGAFRKASVWSVSDSLLTVTLPADVPFGMYLLWVQNQAGVSAPIAVNRTQAQWIGPLGARAVPGGKKRVFGKNMSTGHGASTSYVYLQPQAGGTLTPMAVSAVDPYSVEFTVPAGTAAGNYYVHVHNGHGGAYGWSQPVPLTVAPAWVRDTSEILINPSGGDDSAAIQNAIQQQSARANGGSVRLAAGTFNVRSMLSLKPKVRLTGAGRAETVVQVQLNSVSDASLLLEGDQTELSNLTLKMMSGSAMPRYGVFKTGSYPRLWQDIVVNNVYFTADSGAVASGIDFQLLAERGEFSNNVCDRQLSMRGKDMWIHDSVFRGSPYLGREAGAEAGMIAEEIHRTVIEKNQAITPAWSDPMPYGTMLARRLIVVTLNNGPSDSLYLARNTSQDAAPPGDENKGELVLFHGRRSGWYGQVASNSGNTMTVRTDCLIDGRTYNLWNYADGAGAYCGSITPTLYQATGYDTVVDNMMNATIIAGTGVGQTRRVVSHTGNTITVDKPWRVPPAADSKVTLGYAFEDFIMYGNQLNGFPAGVQTPSSASVLFGVDGNAFNLSVEGNTGNRIFHGGYFGAADLTQSYWNEARGNQVDNVRRDAYSVRFWSAVSSPYPSGTELIGPATIGNVFHNNTARITGPATEAYGNWLYQGGEISGTFSSDTIAAPGLIHAGNIFEGQVTNGGRRGLELGDWSQSLFRKNRITVDENVVLSSWADFHPAQPVRIRRFGNPILGGGSSYTPGTAGAPTYTNLNSSFSTQLIPLNRVALLTGAANSTLGPVAVPVQNAGVATMTWSAAPSQSWITATVSNNTLGAESGGGVLSISANTSGMSPGVYWGMVYVTAGTQKTGVGVRVEVK